MFILQIIFLLSSLLFAEHRCGTLEARAFLQPKPTQALPRLANQLGSTDYPSLTTTHNTPHFAIHYTYSGSHSIENSDLDGSGVNDYLELVEKSLEFAWEFFLITHGFAPPPMGGSDRYHVYLANIDEGYYAWVQPVSFVGDNEQTGQVEETNANTSYMVLRNSYPESVYGVKEEVLPVVVLHEFFHSIQFGYDAYEEGWMLEGMATAMESWGYPETYDNLRYLKILTLAPDAPFSHYYSDEGPSTWEGHEYAIWIFFHALHERRGDLSFTKRTLENSLKLNSNFDNYALQTLAQTLEEFQLTLSQWVAEGYIASYLLSADNKYAPFNLLKADDYLREFKSLTFQPEQQISLPKIGDFLDSKKGNGTLRSLGVDFIEIEIDQPFTLQFEWDPLGSAPLVYAFQKGASDFKVEGKPLTLQDQYLQLDERWLGENLTLMILNSGYAADLNNKSFDLSYSAQFTAFNEELGIPPFHSQKKSFWAITPQGVKYRIGEGSLPSGVFFLFDQAGHPTGSLVQP